MGAKTSSVTASNTANRYRNQAAGRVLSVLSAFIGHAGARGVSELARDLGMNKNMAHRALTTLASEGYLTRDVTGERYQLGCRLLEIASGMGSEFDIVTAARSVLEQIHALTGESVFLSIIVGRNRVTVDDIRAQGPRVLRSQRGHPVPLHCTKMSRVLLSYLTDEEIGEYLAAAAPLPRVMPSPDPPSETEGGVWADIRAIRSQPFVLWRNPHSSAAAYAIFPIPDASGRAHAILTVGGPNERFDLERISLLTARMTAILEPLQEQARLFLAPPFVVDA